MNKYNNHLIIARNTSQMLLIDKLLRENDIVTDMVPTPPETGTVCAIAIKISEISLNKAKAIILNNHLNIKNICQEKKYKLQGLLDKKLESLVSKNFTRILKKIENGEDLEKEELIYLLQTKKQKEIETIFFMADKIRAKMVGEHIEIRAAIEFSNYCQKSCNYCGINSKCTGVKRYRMNENEIITEVKKIKKLGIKTVILQSGEDPLWPTERIAKLTKHIKQQTNMNITLSVGERTKQEYKLLKQEGGDNYLLKIETTNQDIFKQIHPDDDFEYRLKCSKWLKEVGFLSGSGNIIGLPGQTLEDIANDIIYFKNMGIHMIGIGPFIPAKETEYQELPHGDIDLTLRTIAVTRIHCKKVFLPSTTALASLDKEAQVWALKSGANTIMLISTPDKYKENYQIYNDKNMVDLDSAIYAAKKSGRLIPKYLKL